METKVLLLDLEETVIDVWSDHGFCSFNNTEPVRQFIKNGGFSKVGVLSFAIWNDTDLETFDRHLRSELEELFEIRFTTSLIFSVDNLRKEFRKNGLSFEDTSEFLQVCKKDFTFFKILQSDRFRNCDVTLLDDMVPDAILTFPDRVGRMVNVINLEK